MNYVFRIYNVNYSYANYDESICYVKEADINKDDIACETYFSNKDELAEAINENHEYFEGATFCVKDLDDDKVVDSGILDHNTFEYASRRIDENENRKAKQEEGFDF